MGIMGTNTIVKKVHAETIHKSEKMLNDAPFFVVPFHKLWLSIDTINKKRSSLFTARNKKFPPQTQNTSKPEPALLRNATHENLGVNLSIQPQQDSQGTSQLLRVTPVQAMQYPHPSGYEEGWDSGRAQTHQRSQTRRDELAWAPSREHGQEQHEMSLEMGLPITNFPARKKDQGQY